jgi:putative ABC transport system permease protein
MLTDIRFALRLFARSPWFAAAVVLVLGLGAGASTTVFTLVDAYLLKPLPFAEPDRLVALWTSKPPAREGGPWSRPDFHDLRAQASSFSHLATVRWFDGNVSGGSAVGRPTAEHVTGSRVSGDFFALLGVAPALGRSLTPDDEAPGHEDVVVLGDELFRRTFGADPGVVGRVVDLDGRPHTVVGVMPPSFRVPHVIGASSPAAFWAPELTTSGMEHRRETRAWNVLGRLRAGASLGAARSEAVAVAERLGAAHPETNAGRTFVVDALRAELVKDVAPSLTMLFAATLLLLVIASANVALLLLARAAAREGEAAVRAALGASRGRLVRQFLAEGALLALGGGALGFALASFGVRLAAAGFAGAALGPGEVRPDGRVLLFSLGVGSAAGVGAGLWPAWRASRARLGGLLGEGAARSTAGASRRRAQVSFLVAEIALSAVLLAGTAGVARGLRDALDVPLGFAAERTLTFAVHLPAGRYRTGDAARAFHSAFLGRLRALPGVVAAGGATLLPLRGATFEDRFEVEGVPPPAPGREPETLSNHVGGDYFAALGAPVRRGRAFTEADREGGAPVIVVSESFARRYLPGLDPIGRRMRWNGEGPWREIVGVVGDVRHHLPDDGEVAPASYVPFEQDGSSGRLRDAAFVLRAAGDPRALANAARAALAELDAGLPLDDVKTFDERASESLADRRFTLTLVAAFAASALLLTALGLFGLVSYQTRRRSRELAIRMALGAASADVGRLVLRDAARLLLAGLALGLPAAFASGKLLAAQLEGVPPTDLPSLAATSLVLGVVALAAVALPARRAARTPPALVLRDE